MASIYTVSDFQRRYREVLDEARAGLARVRDTNGESMVVLKEARLLVLEDLAAAGANLACLDAARETRGDAALELAAYGDWTWLRSLDDEDLASFVHDLRPALIVGQRETSADLLREELRLWRLTAEELADPLRRSMLLGPVALDDFVPLPRPESREPSP